ncbi:putative membrane protein [Rhodococcus sp. LBL1]|nr:putative membrane protein [Rhodococcus sp. LBL1]MDH6681106.1 putative membrane protein [Rhodococcus sp. LBL2]
MDSIGLRVALCLTFTIAGAVIVWTARAAASGRLGRNPYVGVRTPSTMASDTTWIAAHRASRPLTEIGGWLAIVAGLGALVPMDESMLTAVGIAGAGCLVGFALAGAWFGVRAARAVPTEPDSDADADADAT